MMFHSRAVQRTILRCSAFAFMTAALGEHAHAGGNLEASYTISFARIRVGDIIATVVLGDSEYADLCAWPCWWRYHNVNNMAKPLSPLGASSRTIIPSQQGSPPRSFPAPKPWM